MVSTTADLNFFSLFPLCAAFVTQTAEAMTGAASIIVNDAGSVKLLSVWRSVAPAASKIAQSALLNEVCSSPPGGGLGRHPRCTVYGCLALFSTAGGGVADITSLVLNAQPVVL